MKASTYSNLEGILKDKKQQVIFFQWVIDCAFRNPELFFNILLILVKIIKLIASVFYTPEGQRKTPFWAKALGMFGISFVKKIQDMGDEADAKIRELRMPAIYEHE